MTIILIDKHPIIRTGLSLYINSLYKKVEIFEFDRVSSFCQSITSHDTFLVILGVSHADNISNLEDIIAVKSAYPGAIIIVYDDNTESSVALVYFHAGISGYLKKQSSLAELKICILDVLKGNTYVPDELLKIIIGQYFRTQRNILLPSKKSLTSREREIANYLVSGMKTSWIAEKLSRKVSTISTIKNNIYKKLNVDNVIKLRDALNSPI